MSDELLDETNELLKDRFTAVSKARRVLPSTAEPRDYRGQKTEHLEALVLPDSLRAKMPFTKDKYLVKEHPALVFWERETRKFLRRLSPEHGHRVSAVMVWEWATGLSVQELEQQVKDGTLEGKATWRSDMRHINKVLTFLFGKPGSTWIAGRKVAKAYRVRQGYYIKRHRPLTLTLYAEYCEGSLEA